MNDWSEQRRFANDATIFRNKKRFDGQLALMYGTLYAIARIIAEFFREPDSQLGFLVGNWLTMGILQSLGILTLCVGIFIYKIRKASL